MVQLTYFEIIFCDCKGGQVIKDNCELVPSLPLCGLIGTNVQLSLTTWPLLQSPNSICLFINLSYINDQSLVKCKIQIC